MSDILEKEKKLEDWLRKESNITLGDKLKNFGSNVKSNIKYLIPFGVCLAGAGLVAYLGYRWYEQGQLVEPLVNVKQYLGGLKEVPIWLTNEDYVNEQNKPFARKLWFSGLGGGSELFCYDRDLHFVNMVRGVREDAKGTLKLSTSNKKPKEEKLVYINPFEIDLGD